MSFAGHVLDMIARMKANARRKRDPFDRDVHVRGRMINEEYLRKPDPQYAEQLRSLLVAQQMRERRIRIWIMVISMAIAALLILLLLSQEWIFQRQDWW